MDYPLNINGYPGVYPSQALLDYASCSEPAGGAFICTECGEGFAHYPDLQSHMAMHGPQEPASALQYGAYGYPAPGNPEYSSATGYGAPVQFALQENGTLRVVESPVEFGGYAFGASSKSDAQAWGQSPGTGRTSRSTQTQDAPAAQPDAPRPAENGAGGPNSSHPQAAPPQPPPQFRCEICGRSFNTQPGLLRHQRYRTSERGYKCALCCQSFVAREELRRHLRVHAHEKTFGCGLCGRRVPSAAALAAHREAQHRPGGGTEQGAGEQGRARRFYACEECGLRFFWLSELQGHRGGHRREPACSDPGAPRPAPASRPQAPPAGRPPEPDGPPQSSSRPTRPPPPAGGGSGLRPHHCGPCGKSFAQLAALRGHRCAARLAPAQEKPGRPPRPSAKGPGGPPVRRFPCRFCSRSFLHSSSLSRHVRLHTGDLPHVCGACGKAFVQLCDLERHVHTHSQAGRQGPAPAGAEGAREGRPSCPDCGKAFPGAAALRDHQCPGGTPAAPPAPKPRPSYRCAVCHRVFGLLSVYQRHQRYHFQQGGVYRCGQCPRVFRQPTALTRHLDSHRRRPQGGSPDRAPRAGEEEEEEKVEGGEAPQVLYECTECHQTFACLGTFLQHQSVHGSEVAP
ncbi:zinc finger protein 497 [Lepisosteus oculatus]|uniref:zinc finger protein 497 n=1 Tax=Lepisosteus oculatus TaxID=7918 RepID=UPI0037234C10